MNLDPIAGGRTSSPASSGRDSPAPRTSRRAVEDDLFKADKSLKRYAAIVERALGSWETNPQEWADYIAFLSRLLKAIQTHPKDAPFLPHSAGVASKLSQCLNPALPSGVHQKALEVYAYIFSTFGPEFVSTHLHEYLPGLSGVLAFASLSVKPSLYELFEKFIVRLPADNLRSPLKSLILGLLPAIEEATSEDFEQAFHILEALERKFAQQSDAPENSGYFWQCLFLSVVSSPSKRQGALNFLVQRLPKFAGPVSKEKPGGTEDDLSEAALAMVTPEPGLLIRCFISGLSDSNALVQRGFLDLLLTHLPLHSVVLQKKVGPADLDRLVSAVLHVLLKRDMGLNRRLWSWFLGPDPKDASGDNPPSSPDERRPNSGSAQLRYFESFGIVSLERCVLALFQVRNNDTAGLARPFRICLSLMDRWEIGATVVPKIFMPAIESAYVYSKDASATAVSELLRSASLFFDGVEANLIFANLVQLLRQAFGEESKPDRLDLFTWIITHFNVRDEEMVTTHIPYTLLYLFGLLNTRQSASIPPATWNTAVDTALHLVELMPSRVFSPSEKTAKANGISSKSTTIMKETDICNAVLRFYKGSDSQDRNTVLALGNKSVPELLVDQSTRLTVNSLEQQSTNRHFSQIVPVLNAILGKSEAPQTESLHSLFLVIDDTLQTAHSTGSTLPFPTVQTIVTLLSIFNNLDPVSRKQIRQLEPALMNQIWRYISPNQPKYHVEATRSLWQLGDLVAPGDSVKVSLLDLLRHRDSRKSQVDGPAEHFALLWNHTIPTRAGFSRKGSGFSTLDAEQLSRRFETLIEPLLLVLDGLNDPSHPDFESVRRWLLNLPTLEQIFKILLKRLQSFGPGQTGDGPDSRIQQRHKQDQECELEYTLTQFTNILKYGNKWTWDCFLDTEGTPDEKHDVASGIILLAQASVSILCNKVPSSVALTGQAITVLDILVSSPIAGELRPLEIDSRLIARLIESLNDGDNDVLQGRLLRLITQAIKLRLAAPNLRPAPEGRPRQSLGEKRVSVSAARPSSTQPPTISKPTPPAQLLKCLLMGIESKSSRRHMDQWLSFLSGILPTFSDGIFSNLIPLVECFCIQLDKAFFELVGLTKGDSSHSVLAPEIAITDLLDGLEMILARAHDCLLDEINSEPPPKSPPPTTSFLGNVASGVFKAEGPPSKTTQANSRLTVILAFQDAIRVSLKMWTWASHTSDVDDFDKTSAATTNYSSLRVRNKARQLLEQISTVEPLESLEVMMAHWCHADTQNDASAILSLLQVMHGSRPKNIIPAILDALCSRANPSALPSHRQSSQTAELSTLDVASFLSAYLESTEDDAMDEVWTDCVAFLRDVLSNPLPYRQVLAAMLSITVMLAKKVGNTNFGEQRKMRRELGDIFQRLLAATFTTLPNGFISEPPVDENKSPTTKDKVTRRDISLIPVMTDVVANVDIILDSSDRTVSSVNSISSSIIGPLVHAKAFPNNVGLDVLSLLLEMAKKAPSAKPWKRDVTDAFNDVKLLSTPVDVMEKGWFPVLLQWSLRDKERLPEIISRLAPPSSAGIMFGVGASAARLDADRKTQMNLRRICLLMLASPEDMYVAQLQEIQGKLVELFEASNVSSPSAAIKAELFMLCRAMFLSTSSIQLSPIWPIINENLQDALVSLMPNNPETAAFTNLGLLQACKLLDQLVVLSPDDFQLHEWLYIIDTTDAVYQPADFHPTALSDQVAEALGSSSLAGSQASLQPESTFGVGQRRPLLTQNLAVDKEDIKAMHKDDFARAVLRPFLSQLSMLAYEGMYSMDGPDIASCRRNLLEDVLDLSTIVE